MSRRLGLAVAMVAMFFCSGLALAANDNNPGQKLLRPGHDARARKIGVAKGDAGPATAAIARTAAHPPASPLAPPANDDCSGAIVIPAGTYPVVSAPVDISEATPAGTDDPDVCPTNGVDYTVWFSFTPTASGQYIFSTCAGNGAVGSTVYDTVIGVLDACPGTANSLGCNDTAVGCVPQPAPGAPYVDQSTQAAVLTAGTTYYIAAGHWSGDTGGVIAGLNQISVLVDLSPAPPNDNCSAPTPLPLNRIVQGTTASATNDYRSPVACFAGVGQIASSSNGLDVVFSFTPPADGSYSFRYVQDDSAAALRSQSPVLYLADNCPAPNANAPITGCIAAANRMNDSTTGAQNRSEEINCVPLTGGTPYYLFFDDRFTANAGGPMAVEATECKPETEPNDTLATATIYAPNSSCFMEGSSIAAGPAADIDFYDLGAPPAGSKIFAAVDSAASNSGDYELRITNATDTLGYDDNDGTSWIGSNAPIVAGPIADGSEIYARVNSKTVQAGNEPYNLYARIETGVAQSEDPETQPAGPVLVSDFFLRATHILNGGFVKGVMATQTDNDCFQFAAHEGDNIAFFSDNNPDRVPGTITNVWPKIELVDSNPTPANTRFVGQVLRNNLAPSPGTLTGVTPSVTSEFAHYRARYTGAYVFCFTPTQDVSAENPAAGAYPLPWQGSISVNCGPVPGPQPADVSITKTGPVGPVNTGAIVDYTITITNNDATGIAQDIEMVDTLPAGLSFVGLNVNDGYGGIRNAQVLSLPTPGLNDAPIDIVNVSIAPGASVVYTLTVQVDNCTGAGNTIQNTASITSYTLDTNAANDTASWSFTTAEDGSCNDLICDNSGCISNACTINDHCVAGSCVSDVLNCDDNSVCTADSCDPANVAHPCTNDSSLLGDTCNDGNDCTTDACDPVLFCVFPPKALGIACNDFLSCTNNDACDGVGSCIGHSVCDDGLPCTDDFADEANACACTNAVSFPGTICDDGSVCTAGTTCDGLGGTSASCNLANGGTPLNCDDNNPCTDDSCDPVLGCVHTDNTASCSDGDACTVGDVCGGGTCNSGPAAVCNDGNVCNGLETCSPATGCVAGTPLSCNDNNACNGVETCSPATGCVAGTPLTCNDNNACNGVETCSPATGCVAGTPLVCNNNNACDGVETCNPATGCVAGTALVCNDSNACTTDSCNPATGCVFTNNTAACDDGNACTSGDACGGGSCQAGAPVVCNDSNVCTTDTCNPAVGCVFTNNTNACNDGNACTQSDTCANGACVGSNPVTCTASNSCHSVGVCAPATGICSNPTKPTGSACDDGNACTGNDACNATGACIGGAAPNCDDNSACTADGCDPATGCKNSAANFDDTRFSAGRVDGRDLVVLADAWTSCPGQPAYNPAANLDGLACVDLTDFHLFMTTFGQGCQ